MSDKYLIVGLGNPGRQYQYTRHNVGFMVIDELKRRHQLTSETSERKARTTNGRISNRNVILAKPQTYMNLSGESVRALVDYYHIDINRVIVVHDDLDLPLGTLRLRGTGGHGGQNGIRNIILHLGTKDFARVRFGIGRPPGRMKAKDYVLSGFIKDDEILAQQVLDVACDAIEAWLRNGLEQAMSEYNGDVEETTAQASKPTLQEEIALNERAHELKPNELKPLEKLTRLYKKNRQIDEAVRAHLLAAEIHSDHDNPRQMIYHWEQAAKLRPIMIELREAIAQAYEQQENSKKAVQTWLDLVRYWEDEGSQSKALDALAEAERINPQHPKVHHYRKLLNIE